MATKPKAAPKAKSTPNVPAVAKSTSVVNIAEQLKAMAAQVGERTTAPGGDVISITQAKQFKLPSGEKTDGPIDLIIVDFVSASYYYDGLKYDPKMIRPPGCFAIGISPTTLTPSKNSPNKQNESCSKCPHNEYKSDPHGEGKACKNMRFLACLPPDFDEKTPFAIIRVSPTATRIFDGYVQSVARQFELPPMGVVTEISINPDLDYPQLNFGNPKPLSKDKLAIAFSRSNEARARLLVEPDVSGWTPPASKGKPAPAKRK